VLVILHFQMNVGLSSLP